MLEHLQVGHVDAKSVLPYEPCPRAPARAAHAPHHATRRHGARRKEPAARHRGETKKRLNSIYKSSYMLHYVHI